VPAIGKITSKTTTFDFFSINSYIGPTNNFDLLSMNRVGRNYKWKGPHIYYASITSHLKYEGQKYISVYSCFKKEKERKKKHIFKTNF